MKCTVCGKPLPSVSESKQGAKGLLCYEHFLKTDTGRDLLNQPYEPPAPIDTGAGGPGRYIDQIHIHHSASDSGNAASFDYYHSVILGWGEIAYNLVICNGFGGGDGEAQLGKTDDRYPFSVGVDSLNRRALAVVYVGNFSPGRYPTPKQWTAGVNGCRGWINLYPTIIQSGVGGHRQFNANSACPGFEDSRIAEMVAEIFGSNTEKPQEEDDMPQPVPLNTDLTKWQGYVKAGTVFYVHLSSGDAPGVHEPKGETGYVVIFEADNGWKQRDNRAIRTGVTLLTFKAPRDGVYSIDSVSALPTDRDESGEYIPGPSIVVQAA